MAHRAPKALRRRSWLRSFPRLTPTASPGLRLEHCLLQLGFRQKLLEASVFLFQLGEPFGLLSLHAPVLLFPAVVGRLGNLDSVTDVGDSLALSGQLLSDLELADDLFGCVADSFHDEVPGPVWPDEDSHSPWTDLQDPRHA